MEELKKNSAATSVDAQRRLLLGRRLRRTAWLAGIIGAFLISLVWMDIDPQRVIEGMNRFAGTVRMMFPPSLGILPRLIDPALESFYVAITGTALGIVLSFIIGVLGAHNLTPHPVVEIACKGFAAFTRAVPALIWALLFIVAVGLGPLPGVLALGVNSVGMLGKVFAETIEEIDPGGIEAVRASGANGVQVIAKAVVPVVTPAFVSWILFRVDINLRYASVLGVVGAGGIGLELVRTTRMLDFQGALTVTLVIFFMVWSVEAVNNRIRAFVR